MESADAFYRVAEDEINRQIFAGDLGFITVSNLRPGDRLGWAWLLPPHTWRLSACGQAPASVLAGDAKT